MAFGRGLADNALNLVVVDVGEETAVLFDFEEYFPCLFGDCYGESLNIIAAAGGIDNLVEVAFLLEKELLVAGYALAEIIGGLIADIERSCRYRVDTGQSSRHCLGLAAQQVDVGVVDSLVEARGDSVDVHLAAAVAGGLIFLDDLSPEHTGCAEFGKLHEVVRAYTHIEFDALCYCVSVETGLGKHCHPLCAPAQSIAEFLIDIGTGI